MENHVNPLTLLHLFITTQIARKIANWNERVVIQIFLIQNEIDDAIRMKYILIRRVWW